MRTHRHPSGAVLVFDAAAIPEGCLLYCPDGRGTSTTVLLDDALPDTVVIAACLAASDQLDPVQAREDSTWLGWLEAAGVDNWQGMGVAQDMREEYEREQQQSA